MPTLKANRLAPERDRQAQILENLERSMVAEVDGTHFVIGLSRPSALKIRLMDVYRLAVYLRNERISKQAAEYERRGLSPEAARARAAKEERDSQNA